MKMPIPFRRDTAAEIKRTTEQLSLMAAKLTALLGEACRVHCRVLRHCHPVIDRGRDRLNRAADFDASGAAANSRLPAEG
jgi:hypothetical protein